MSKNIRAILLAVVLVLLAACASSSSQQTGISDRAKIGAAKAELATVRNGLGMYQAENDTSAYPGAAMVTSHQDLIDILSPYIRMPEPQDASWTFSSYARAREDTFVLRARALDKARTWITVTPMVIPPKSPVGVNNPQ